MIYYFEFNQQNLLGYSCPLFLISEDSVTQALFGAKVSASKYPESNNLYSNHIFSNKTLSKEAVITENLFVSQVLFTISFMQDWLNGKAWLATETIGSFYH